MVTVQGKYFRGLTTLFRRKVKADADEASNGGSMKHQGIVVADVPLRSSMLIDPDDCGPSSQRTKVDRFEQATEGGALRSTKEDILESHGRVSDLNALRGKLFDHSGIKIDYLMTEHDHEKRQCALQEITVIQEQTRIVNQALDSQVHHYIQLLQLLPQLVHAYATVISSYTNIVDVSLKAAELGRALSCDVDGVLNTHILVTLLVWGVLMIGNYASLIFVDKYKIFGVSLVIAVPLLKTLGLASVLSATFLFANGASKGASVLSATFFAKGARIHGLGVIGALLAFLLVSNLLGYNRIWLRGAWSVCIALCVYACYFEYSISPYLHANWGSMTETKRMFFQWLAGFAMALSVTCTSFQIFHTGSHCVLPFLPSGSNIRYSSDCAPLMAIDPNFMCSVECKVGYSNRAALPPVCNGYLWNNCVETTWQCSMTTQGPAFGARASLQCMAEASDPYDESNLVN
jgi:hypothetical protein